MPFSQLVTLPFYYYYAGLSVIMHTVQEKKRLKNIILDTIRMMCKNGLMVESESSFRIEATVGITLSSGDVILLSFKEKVNPDGTVVSQMLNDEDEQDGADERTVGQTGSYLERSSGGVSSPGSSVKVEPDSYDRSPPQLDRISNTWDDDRAGDESLNIIVPQSDTILPVGDSDDDMPLQNLLSVSEIDATGGTRSAGGRKTIREKRSRALPQLQSSVTGNYAKPVGRRNDIRSRSRHAAANRILESMRRIRAKPPATSGPRSRSANQLVNEAFRSFLTHVIF